MHVKWNRNLDGIRRSNSPTNSSSSSMTVTSSGSSSGSSTDSDDLPFADAEESSIANGGCGGGGIGDTRSMNHTLRKNFLARMTQSDSADFSAPMLPRPPHQVTDLAEAALAHPRPPETKDENSESDENLLLEHRGLSNHQNSLLLFHNNNNNNSPMDVQYQTTTTNSEKQGLSNCTALNTKLNSVSTTPMNGGQATSQNFKSRKRDNFALKLTSSRRQLIANHLRQQSALLSFRSSNSPSPMRPQSSSAASPMSNRITSKGALATLIGLFRFRDSVDDLNNNNNNNGSNSGFKSHARHFRRRLSLERLTTNSTSSHNGNAPAPSQSTVATSPNCRQPLLERHPAGTSLRYRQRSNSLLMLQDIALSPDYGPQPSQNHNVPSQNSPEFLPELTAPPLPPKPAPPVAVEINLSHQQQQEQKSSTDSPGVPIGAPSSCDSTHDDHIDNNHTTSDNHNNNNNNLAVDNNRLDHYFDDNLENCVPIIDHSQLTPISTHSPRSPSTNQNHHHHNHLSPAIITATALITETPRKSLVKFINDEPSYTILDPGCRSFLEHNHQHNLVATTKKSSKPLQGILRVRNNNNFYGDSALDSLRSSSASSSLSSNSSGSFSGASSGGSGGAPTVTTTNHKRVRFARPLLTYAIIEGS